MVPFGINGKLSEISEGKYTVNENVIEIKTTNGKSPVGLYSWWMVRTPRPVFRKLPPESPLLTGQRVLIPSFLLLKEGLRLYLVRSVAEKQSPSSN